MTGRDNIQSLLALRKLTRAIGDAVRAQVIEYLAILTPLLRPSAVLGDYIQGGAKDNTHKADKTFKELQALYARVAVTKPFNLRHELTPPFNLSSVGLDITPVEYTHSAQSGPDARKIVVRSPLTWALTYTGFAPARLQELLESKGRTGDELQRFVLSYLVMHLAITTQPGVAQILRALHFPVTTATVPEFGDLPITRIGVDISTTRPSDAVLIESAELTGMDAFEEVVNVDDVAALRDPLRERLLEIVRRHTPAVV